MILVDTALRALSEAHTPLRVGLIGAGFIGRGVAHQILTGIPGMEIVVIASRNAQIAEETYSVAGAAARLVSTVAELEDAVRGGIFAVTEDAGLVCSAPCVDVVIEATGDVESGARFVLLAVDHGKPVVMVNVQLDATLGPILKTYADKAGVLISGTDGDQPGEQLNLCRRAKGMGMIPLVCGNIKGLLDHYRTPETQRSFADAWGQKANMITSFADGTEISFEQATVANAAGMQLPKSVTLGRAFGGHVRELTESYDLSELVELGGVIDYVVGAQPSPGVFVLATHPDPIQQRYLDYYKMGKGPLYCLYTPHIVVHFSIPFSAARLSLFKDVVMAPLGRPMVDVVATAKTDLCAGQVLDGIGGFSTYGKCENADVTHARRYLPMGLAEGCRLARPVKKDEVMTYQDVEPRRGRLSDRLRMEQDAMFFGKLSGARDAS